MLFAYAHSISVCRYIPYYGVSFPRACGVSPQPTTHIAPSPHPPGIYLVVKVLKEAESVRHSIFNACS